MRGILSGFFAALLAVGPLSGRTVALAVLIVRALFDRLDRELIVGIVIVLLISLDGRDKSLLVILKLGQRIFAVQRFGGGLGSGFFFNGFFPEFLLRRFFRLLGEGFSCWLWRLRFGLICLPSSMSSSMRWSSSCAL